MKFFIDDLLIKCNEITDVPDAIPIDSIDNKATYQMNYIFYTFFISNHMVIGVNNHCY